MYKKISMYFRSLFVTLMNLIGYEKYVKISGDDAKPVWFRTYKLRPKNFTFFLIKKALRQKHNFSKNELWSYNSPSNHLVFSNGNKHPPTDYVVYMHPRMIQAAVDNPVPHPGSNIKTRKTDTKT